jgi:hypothetical protein
MAFFAPKVPTVLGYCSLKCTFSTKSRASLVGSHRQLLSF